MPLHDHPGPCAGLDHRHWHYTLMWCEHRQAWSVESYQFTETGLQDGDSGFRRRHLELGPFDALADVQELLVRWVGADLAAEAGSPPRLPGS